MYSRIDGNLYRNMLICGAHLLDRQKDPINKLNVFPVPDGDTGTNMSATMLDALKEIKANISDEIGDTAECASMALLRAARGNSGVILSLLFRGIAKRLSGEKDADAKLFAAALKAGVDTAYKAVMKPTEGTMLTVARESAEYAQELAPNCENIDELMRGIVERAKESLARTPELLPVLKEAGVVDAGGQGLLTVYEGMLRYLVTETMIEPAQKTQQEQTSTANFLHMNPDDIKFMYCTEFLIHSSRGGYAHQLERFLQTIGDSVLVVEEGDIAKIHVHTNNPGTAIEKALTYGWLSKVKIENMKEQHTQLQFVSEPVKPQKKYGVVAVAQGDGLTSVFKDMGADIVVSGGQSMNPSTADILKAIEDVPSEIVYVLPNNKNIIMAAEQTINITQKKVHVLPTRTIPQGIAAMLGFDPGQDAATNFASMKKASRGVKTGLVTFAERDSTYDGKHIKKGQILSLMDGKLSGVGDTVSGVSMSLIKRLAKDCEVVTIYYGLQVDQPSAQRLAERAQKALGRKCEVMLMYGGQPVYYYIISCE